MVSWQDLLNINPINKTSDKPFWVWSKTQLTLENFGKPLDLHKKIQWKMDFWPFILKFQRTLSFHTATKIRPFSITMLSVWGRNILLSWRAPLDRMQVILAPGGSIQGECMCCLLLLKIECSRSPMDGRTQIWKAITTLIDYMDQLSINAWVKPLGTPQTNPPKNAHLYTLHVKNISNSKGFTHSTISS